MNRRNFCLGIPAAALGVGLLKRSAAAKDIDVTKYQAAAIQRWEKEIAKLDERNKTEKHPKNSVLFVGSSSIRGWQDIATDMAPYHPIQRGYGGARWSDVAVFAERLISPHKFRGAVFFVGNDIRGKDDDKTPAEVAGLFSHVLAKLRDHNKQAPVFYVAVTPTESRFDAWRKIKEANTAARAVCGDSENTYFIGTESVFLNAEGKPRPELFRKDRLHLNRDGYALWAAAIKSHLDTVLDGSA